MTLNRVDPVSMTMHGHLSDSEIRGARSPRCPNCGYKNHEPHGLKHIAKGAGREVWWKCWKCETVIALKEKYMGGAK
jgi:DNA-directed RNA polymerase subunit RPC12/RpoP